MTDGRTSLDAVEASPTEAQEPTLEQIRRQIYTERLAQTESRLKEAQTRQAHDKIREAQAEVDLMLYVEKLQYEMKTNKNPDSIELIEIIEGELPDTRKIKLAEQKRTNQSVEVRE